MGSFYPLILPLKPRVDCPRLAPKTRYKFGADCEYADYLIIRNPNPGFGTAHRAHAETGGCFIALW